jgi:aryl-alcohol dehydrogenase-like predicted oxidoreductase
MTALNNSGIKVFDGIEMGIGTWAWGDRMFWGYGDQYKEKDVEEAFNDGIANGITFFDTAETYGLGKSELILGKLIKKENKPIKIATKMMPYPWRLCKGSLKKALKDSLKRLDLDKVDLYQMHFPLKPISVNTWMERMADVVEEGLITSIGVSNYNLEQTRSAHETLKRRGYGLASNQMEYHLLNRKIETNGIKEYCQNEGIKIIAYSPLAMGVLTGKYTPENPPRGVRAGMYNRGLLERIQPLIRIMSRIGNEHEGKTAGQVALNWAIQKDTLPIPGAKNTNQMSQNLGALGWKLTPDEMEILDEVSMSVSQVK